MGGEIMTDEEIDEALLSVNEVRTAIAGSVWDTPAWLKRVGRPCARAILAANDTRKESLRDEFAKSAMSTILNAEILDHYSNSDLPMPDISSQAYRLADEMLLARQRGK
jgi:hypothetical protein